MNHDDDLKRELYAFLSRHQVMNLAYYDAQGPGVCAVWFAVRDDLTVIFLSERSTRHAAALARGATVAFTVQKDDQNWRSIQGVQGTGYCQVVADEHRASAWNAYSSRFPFVIQPLGTLGRALAVITLWSVTPTWLRLIDNTKGFGHKEELVLRNEFT